MINWFLQKKFVSDWKWNCMCETQHAPCNAQEDRKKKYKQAKLIPPPSPPWRHEPQITMSGQTASRLSDHHGKTIKWHWWLAKNQPAIHNFFYSRECHLKQSGTQTEPTQCKRFLTYMMIKLSYLPVLKTLPLPMRQVCSLQVSGKLPQRTSRHVNSCSHVCKRCTQMSFHQKKTKCSANFEEQLNFVTQSCNVIVCKLVAPSFQLRSRVFVATHYPI